MSIPIFESRIGDFEFNFRKPTRSNSKWVALRKCQFRVQR